MGGDQPTRWTPLHPANSTSVGKPGLWGKAPAFSFSTTKNLLDIHVGFHTRDDAPRQSCGAGSGQVPPRPHHRGSVDRRPDRSSPRPAATAPAVGSAGSRLPEPLTGLGQSGTSWPPERSLPLSPETQHPEPQTRNPHFGCSRTASRLSYFRTASGFEQQRRASGELIPAPLAKDLVLHPTAPCCLVPS